MTKCKLCDRSITTARDENTKVCLKCALKLNALGYVKRKNTGED